jgi:hypothetical protein
LTGRPVAAPLGAAVWLVGTGGFPASVCITFVDVPGIDEAENELVEIVAS